MIYNWMKLFTHAKGLELHLPIEVHFISWVHMVRNFVMPPWGLHFLLVQRLIHTTFDIWLNRSCTRGLLYPLLSVCEKLKRGK